MNLNKIQTSFARIGRATLFCTSFILLLSGCQQGYRSDQEAKSMKDTTTMYMAPLSSSAAVEKNKDPERKFIRTADIKFKVKNVIKSTYTIEDVTTRFGGFVTYTSLKSNIDNKVTTPVSADSTLEMTYFTVSNDMTIRVPNTSLDTTLKSIAKLVDFMDYRIIKADDVGLQILANKLTQRRTEHSEQRISRQIDSKGKKLNDGVAAEENVLGKQEQADNAAIANMDLNDKVRYSTISLNLYQRQEVKKELVQNDKNIKAFEPGFGTKLLSSLKTGWEVLEDFLLFLVRLWAPILIIIGLYLLYRKYRARLFKS